MSPLTAAMNHPAASCRPSNVKVPSLNGRGLTRQR
jgi:hypothetical protein